MVKDSCDFCNKKTRVIVTIISDYGISCTTNYCLDHAREHVGGFKDNEEVDS